MDAYLAHVQADRMWKTDGYLKIDVAIVDRETQEKGEGSVFWRPPRYEEGTQESEGDRVGFVGAGAQGGGGGTGIVGLPAESTASVAVENGRSNTCQTGRA